MTIKLGYDPINNIPLLCGDTNCHAATLPNKNFDKYIRALYFKEYKTIYFRFYSPSGEYTYIDDRDIQRSFRICDIALKAFIKEKLIPKKVKVLYWQNDNKVTNSLTRY